MRLTYLEFLNFIWKIYHKLAMWTFLFILKHLGLDFHLTENQDAEEFKLSPKVITEIYGAGRPSIL